MQEPIATDRLDRDIASFFNYFRARVDNVVALDAQSRYRPDQHVLIAAGLDALAGYWARLFAPGATGGAERMGLFLVTHGDSQIFGKCSGPDAMRRALREGKPWVSVLGKAVRHSSVGGLVRTWNDDPDYEALSNERDIVAAGIDTKWLRASRYGEILYRHYRCAWVHELDGSNELSYFHEDDLSVEPRYQNMMIYVADHPPHKPAPVERRLILTRGFLIATYQNALRSFETECRKVKRNPLPK